MVHTLDEIAHIRSNMENRNTNIIQRKENKFSFPTELALPNLKNPLLNCPGLSIRILDKLRFRVID